MHARTPARPSAAAAAAVQVVVEGRALTAAAVPRKYYFALNKPKGYVCSTKLEAGRGGAGGGEGRLVTDLFKDWLREWRQRQPKVRGQGGVGWAASLEWPVGRLAARPWALKVARA